MLDTFEKKRVAVSWIIPDAIIFQLLMKGYVMSYTEFSIQMRIYDEDFAQTTKYENLPFCRPLGELML